MIKELLAYLKGEKNEEKGSSLDECAVPWKSYREELVNQKLDLEKQIDKTVFAISSGAIGISLAIIDKIAPSPNFWYLYFMIGIGWIFLVISLMLQTFSFINTAKRLKDSIAKVEEIIVSASMEQLSKKEEEYYTFWKSQNVKIDKDNKKSLRFMIWGIALILLFAFVGLFTRENKQNQSINITLSDSLTYNILNMAKSGKPQDTSKQTGKTQTKTFSDTTPKKSGKMESGKNAQQIITPPVKTTPKK